MLLKNVKVLRPKTTKIQKRNGVAYVYQVTGKVYKKDKKYTVDERKLIGKMMDDRYMIPNEYFSQFYPEVSVGVDPPEFSDTLKIGSFLVIQKIMEDLPLKKLIESVFGDGEGKCIEDLVSYIITSETCTFQYYTNFMRNHPVMEERLRDDTQISRFLKYLIKDEDIQLFMTGWNQMMKSQEYIYLNYDSTNFNTHADGIEIADYGHAKVDEGLPQFNLSYSIRQEDSMPLYYELYDGSVIDNTQMLTMLELAEEYGYEKIGFILDRGYISKRNIQSMRKKGYSYILMLKGNQSVCRTVMKEYGAAVKSLEGYYIEDHDVYGKTVQTQLYGEEEYVHIYYDDVRASEEKLAWMARYSQWEKELDKKVEKKTAVKEELNKYKDVFKFKYDRNGYLIRYQRNSRYIKEEMNKLGFFFILTREEMEASKVLDIYRGRDNIEKMFRSLKSGVGFEKARVHTMVWNVKLFDVPKSDYLNPILSYLN